MSKEYYRIGGLKMPKVGKGKFKVILNIDATKEEKIIARQKIRKEAFEYADKVYTLNESKLSDKYTRNAFNKSFVSFLTQEAKNKEIEYFGKYKKELTTLSISNASKKIQGSDIFLFGETDKNKRYARAIIKGSKLEKDIKRAIYGNDSKARFKSLNYNFSKFEGFGEYDGKNFELVSYSEKGKDIYILITYKGKYSNEKQINFISEYSYNEYKRHIYKQQ